MLCSTYTCWRIPEHAQTSSRLPPEDSRVCTSNVLFSGKDGGYSTVRASSSEHELVACPIYLKEGILEISREIGENKKTMTDLCSPGLPTNITYVCDRYYWTTNSPRGYRGWVTLEGHKNKYILGNNRLCTSVSNHIVRQSSWGFGQSFFPFEWGGPLCIVHTEIYLFSLSLKYNQKNQKIDKVDVIISSFVKTAMESGRPREMSFARAWKSIEKVNEMSFFCCSSLFELSTILQRTKGF